MSFSKSKGGCSDILKTSIHNLSRLSLFELTELWLWTGPLESREVSSPALNELRQFNGLSRSNVNPGHGATASHYRDVASLAARQKGCDRRDSFKLL
jgi:hypothetical protein